MTLNGGREVGWLQASAGAKKDEKRRTKNSQKTKLQRNPVEPRKLPNYLKA